MAAKMAQENSDNCAESSSFSSSSTSAEFASDNEPELGQ